MSQQEFVGTYIFGDMRGVLVSYLYYFNIIMCEKKIYMLYYIHAIFIHVHKFILSKLNKTSNSMVCTSKQELELITSV
jgi:hypothetical protein